MENRSQSIDSMRGIACIGVVITHSNLTNWIGMYGNIAKVGARGVQIFFVISAFLIFKSLEEHGAGTDKPFNIIKWYYNKFLRLIPLYWTAIVIFFIIYGSSYWTLSSNKKIFISDFLFISGLDPFHLNVFWYLGALGLFIIVAPFLYRIITNWVRAVFLFGATYAVFSIIIPIIADRINIGYNFESWSTYWRSLSFFSNLPVLSLGILLYFLYYHEKVHIIIRNSVIKYNVDIKYISRIFLLCLIILLGEKIYNNGSIVEYALLLCALLFNEMMHNNAIITNFAFSFLGKYSYGIYLFHLPVLHILQSKLDGVNTLIVVTITIVLTLFISIMVTNIIEKPIISKLRK